MARGGETGAPYALRWLLPAILRDDFRAWNATALAATLAFAPLCYFLALSWGLTALNAALSALLAATLPSTGRLWLTYPVLTDHVGMCLAVASAIAALSGQTWLCVAISLAAGATRETAPMFAAAYSLNPLPLIGLIAVPWWRLRTRAKLPPRARKRPWPAYLGGWGPTGALAAAGAVADPQLAFACLPAAVLGYAQLLVANDSARLYSWAAPCLCLLACAALPTWVILVAIAAQSAERIVYH